MFSKYKNHFEIFKLSFQSNKFSLSAFLLFCVIFFSLTGLILNYASNYLSGKLTDSLVDKKISLIIKFIFYSVGLYIVWAFLSAIKDYVAKKLHIIMRYNLYNNLGAKALNDQKYTFSCQKMSVELDCFSNSLLRLTGYAVESIVSFPMFIMVLYNIGGINIIYLTFIYAIFGQIVSGYFANIVYKTSYCVRDLESDLRRKLIIESKKENDNDRILPNMDYVLYETFKLYRSERLLAIFRDSFGNLKGYVPYVCLLTPYLQDSITLGDTVRAIGAFRYVMRSIGFVTDNRLNLVQLNISVQRINELRK